MIREQAMGPRFKAAALRLLLLAGVGLALAFALHQLKLDWQQLLLMLQQFSPLVWLVGLGIVLVQIAFQSSRLWVFCPPAVGITWPQAVKAFVTGQFISNFIQNQTGHAMKVAVIRKPADAQGRAMSMAESAAIVVVDKVTDVSVLLVLTGLALLQLGLSAQRYLDFNVLWGVVAAGAAITLVYTLCRYSQRMRQWLSEFQRGLAVVKSPTQVGCGLAMALGDWCSEGVLLHLLCLAQGVTVSPAQLIVSLFVLNLGISVPVSVANLGTFEASLTFALTRFGVPLVQGVAIATLFHIFQMVGIALWMLPVLAQNTKGEA